MIQKQTKVYVGDNTMILKALTIHLYGGFFRKQTNVANYLLVSIPERRIRRPFITKNIYLGIIVTQAKKYRRIQGFYIQFALNKIVLLSEQKKFIATRIYGPIADEVRQTKLTRVLTIARKIC